MNPPSEDGIRFTGAKLRWTTGQAALGLSSVAICLLGWKALPLRQFALLSGAAAIVLFGGQMGLRLSCVLLGLFRGLGVHVGPEEIAAHGGSWPMYTVLLPVFREPQVLNQLLRAVDALDYPHDRLDVKLLLESNDPETAQALAAVARPAWLEIVPIPKGEPQTKPRACDCGLAKARGSYLVVFDAEDKPEPDQLKKAVVAFSKAGAETVCLQAKLNCYNTQVNWLTKLFTLEYTTWFDLYLPGLHAFGAPIPLGGSSNHFITSRLLELGGWDPYNVTEDCDLGLRISRKGFVTRILDSTTWEEAPSRPIDWFKQRTRWMKGYLQCFLVHSRGLAPWAELGPFGSLFFVLLTGGQVATLLLLPAMWALVGAWFVLKWPIADPRLPWTYALFWLSVTLGLFNFIFVLIHVLGAQLRRLKGLEAYALLFPLYWFCISMATWRSLWQFVFDPFKWEKTPHGRGIVMADGCVS